jgi:hypothetical protein
MPEMSENMLSSIENMMGKWDTIFCWMNVMFKQCLIIVTSLTCEKLSWHMKLEGIATFFLNSKIFKFLLTMYKHKAY